MNAIQKYKELTKTDLSPSEIKIGLENRTLVIPDHESIFVVHSDSDWSGSHFHGAYKRREDAEKAIQGQTGYYISELIVK